jgi:hypothetical protein
VQARLHSLLSPRVSCLARSLSDIVAPTSDISVVMDRDYRIVQASKAHRQLLR